jgi:hypothetical protein
MANTAFYGTMSIKHPNGTVECDRFDSTDVSAVYTTWKNNGGNTFYRVKQSGYITDFCLNIVATDTTTYFKLYIDQRDTGIMFLQAACFPTLSVHFPNNSPIPVQAGQQVMLQAMT